jgi:hypothetical protein
MGDFCSICHSCLVCRPALVLVLAWYFLLFVLVTFPPIDESTRHETDIGAEVVIPYPHCSVGLEPSFDPTLYVVGAEEIKARAKALLENGCVLLGSLM